MKEKLKKVVSILIISILVFSAICSTYAVTQQDLQDIRDDISEAEQQKREVEANLSQQMKELQVLSGEADEVRFNLNNLKKELSNLQSEIDTLEKELQKKEEEYNVRYENACKRIEAQYVYGKITFLDCLLKAASLTDFLSNYYMVEQLLKDDESFLEELEVEKQEIENEKTTFEEKKQKVEEEKKQVEQQNLILANKENEMKKIVSTLNEQDAALRKQIEADQAELARQEEIWSKQAANAGGSGGTYSGGELLWPCPSYTRVSSRFGSRSSPLAGGSSYHKGVDLAAPKGSSILAAESGTVITVYNGCSHNYGKQRSCGCGGGFGNYVMVSHGSGLVTVYAHCTSINVSVGSKVSRGSVIATVGTTGASTGYHLHFGVLLNGTYVNPAPYIGL